MLLAWSRFLVALFTAVGLLGSCSGSPTDAALEECPGDTVNLAVSAGLSPMISWTPACGMGSLDVFPAAGGSSLWVLYSRTQADNNPFRSGLRYGRAPAEALQVTGPVPLVAGTEYRVAVYRHVQGTRLQAGVASFRP